MKLLITGGTGFLGKHLLDVLDNDGYLFTVVSRKAKSSKYETLTKDLLEITKDDLVSYDAIIHMAGLTPNSQSSEADYLRQNRDVTAHLINLAEQATTRRFIYISTSSVYYDGKSAYAQSKKLAEKAVTDSSLNWVVLRPSYIFGRDNGFWENLFNSLGDAKKTLFLKGSASTKFHPVFVKDVANAILACVKNETVDSKCYNLAGPKPLTYRDFYRKFREVSGRAFKIVTIPKWMAPLGIIHPKLQQDKVADQYYDISDTQADIGYSPRSYENAFREILNVPSNG